jgi:hypothetical protein
MSKKTSTGKIAVEIGAGIVAVGAAAVAGYYFYGTKKAKNHRKIASQWASDMKDEVLQKAKMIQDIDAVYFAGVVDTVADTYRGVKNIASDDLARAVTELKSHWVTMQKEIQDTRKVTKVVGKKVLAEGKKKVKKVISS